MAREGQLEADVDALRDTAAEIAVRETDLRAQLEMLQQAVDNSIATLAQETERRLAADTDVATADEAYRALAAQHEQVAAQLADARSAAAAREAQFSADIATLRDTAADSAVREDELRLRLDTLKASADEKVATLERETERRVAAAAETLAGTVAHMEGMRETIAELNRAIAAQGQKSAEDEQTAREVEAALREELRVTARMGGRTARWVRSGMKSMFAAPTDPAAGDRDR